jgi:hypothetical protein
MASLVYMLVPALQTSCKFFPLSKKVNLLIYSIIYEPVYPFCHAFEKESADQLVYFA